MQIHEVKPKNKAKKKKRIGRGGKRGTYSGRGMKGQKSRAGTRKMKPLIRESLKRYPKLRGYNFSSRKKVSIFNIATLDKFFDDGSEINPKSILKKGLVQKGSREAIKILGNGETKKKFYIKGCLVSENAKKAILKEGGAVSEIKKKEERKEKSKKEKVVSEKDKKEEVVEEKKNNKGDKKEKKVKKKEKSK